ncbi:alpha-amylase family glycosyl hydrolase [uncultured Dokdonia sp.]|uniref:alpha-amylase family glycosyl hydrolase n=1 Tax=uncultured Dokdonia sp. TaxID=575653 RepID=UPI0030EB9DFA|tara:strand:- start:156433 stop:157875 length:1443 start_codon:yes stop_codon:yes gene_type:complete
MKKHFLSLAVIVTTLCSCEFNTTNETPAFAKALSNTSFQFDETMEESSVIYEVNIRQYSPEGTFTSFTKDIPVLKELGIKILWVMPIFPISETNRKGSLGSYYAVSDFREVNPEFGTLQDVDNMIKVAHEHGIAVVLDWVPNHTGWNHTWITKHPEWYTQNDKGEIVDPIDPATGKSWGWTDVADLNYDNQAMRDEMIADLSYWVQEHDVDGFRMDVAHKVPVPFFKRAIDSLEQIKSPFFMLAEAEQEDLMANGFDIHYAWQMHHLLNEIAKEEKSVEDFWTLLAQYDQTLAQDDMNMYFVTNHDENSWAGTLGERMPDNKEIFTTLTYMLPGMPLIYSGQEYDLDKRLQFFEKDSIPKEKGSYFELLKKLGELKNNRKSLHGGKTKASLIKLEASNPEILTFGREKEGDQLLFIGNFSSSLITTKIPLSGAYVNALTGEDVAISGTQEIPLKAWEFYILSPKTHLNFDTRVIPNTVNE